MTNRLLNSLSAHCRSLLLANAKNLSLPVQTSLIQLGEPLKYAYFMTSGIASVVVELAEGGTAEVALIGAEGMVGGLQLLGPALSPARSFIQLDASGYRIPFQEVRKVFSENEEFRTRVLEMVQQQSLTIAQLSACNRLHEAEARLARWLLMVQDRVTGDTLSLTQEFLAQMLGTQRTTVVMAAGAMQRSGLITYSRGKITIISRPDLEAAACDCYHVVRTLFDNLYQQ